MDSPIDEGLSSAFGDDESSFTATVTGLISTVTSKFKGDAAPLPTRPEEPVLELPTPAKTSDSGGSLFSSPKVIGLAAVVALAVAGASYWFLGGDDEAMPVAEPAPMASSPAVPEAEGDAGAETQASVDVAALVDEARLAREAGQIYNPVGSNAIELYAAAVAADPSNAIHAAELDAVVQQALGMAETALLEARVDEAEAALQRVGLVDPRNARLPFLTAQLWQMQLRNHLTNARAAIRDRRFEDAGNSVAAAIALNIGDPEIDVVRAELNQARSAQQEDDVLVKANARLAEGMLLSPANDNARYYYELMLADDPQNTAARQGLNVVASKLVLQARSEIDAGNLDSAEALLYDAGEIDASNPELTAAATALAGAREAIVRREQRAAQEQRRIEEANRQAAIEKEAAERRLAEQAAAEQAAAEAAAAQAAAAQTVDEPVADTGNAVPASADAAVTTKEAAGTAAKPVVEPPAEAKAQASTPPARAGDAAPVSISSLTRTRYVAPKFPRTAQRRNQSGWVDVVFTVAMDGSVKDLEIKESTPEGVFDNAALRAVEKWEFEPVIENGVLVEKRAGVRMMFAIE